MKFGVQKVTRPGSHGLLGTKWGQVPWPISLKRLNKKKTPLVQFEALLEIRIILKNEPNRCILQGVANFSKTAERNKTLFTGIQVRLKLSSNQQTDQKSVHSTRRYSNIKVPYQMSKVTKYGSCFAKIHHLDSIKLHTKYIW